MSPLREPPTNTTDSVPAWMPEKTEDERKEIIATLREVELKWAKRCLCAILILTALAVSGGLAAWAVLRRWFEPHPHTHGLHSSSHNILPLVYLASQITELYDQQNFAFHVYLTNSLFSWRSASCSPFDREWNVSITRLSFIFFCTGIEIYILPRDNLCSEPNVC